MGRNKMKINFKVEGIPPKKDGANSMWGKEKEAERIIRLRKEVLKEIKKQGIITPINSFMNFTIEIYLPSNKIESAGDLDNFITGICDGLQKANNSSKKLIIHDFFEKENKDINPAISFIENDSKIISIFAKKFPSESKEEYYEITLETIGKEDV